MLAGPWTGLLRTQTNMGSVGSSTAGTSVTTGAAAGTKGTAVELISSTSFDSFWIEIIAHSYAASVTDSRGCLDLLVGAATEEVAIANLLMGSCGALTGNTFGPPKTWGFPLYIPAGTRIAAQVAGARTSTAMRVGVILYGGTGSPWWRVGSSVTTYGVSSVPDGTTVTPGASGAEGSWTQITASTSRDHFCVVPSLQLGNDTSANFQPVFLDVGVGSATEEMILESAIYAYGANESTSGPLGRALGQWQDIPSGTRLAARLSGSTTADTSHVALHCVS